MGIIRKTVSIGTLGIVPFRSKRELVRRAERDRRAASVELGRLQIARATVDERLTAAERRLRAAEATAQREAAAAAAGKRPSRRARRRASRSGADRSPTEVLVDLVAATQPVAQDQAKAVGRRARKAAARAQVAAERAQHEAKKTGRRARARARDAQRAVAPHVEATRDRAVSFRDDLVERASAAAIDLREKAEASRSSD